MKKSITITSILQSMLTPEEVQTVVKKKPASSRYTIRFNTGALPR
ncbi:hypothetical protein [Paenibacillus terrae]|nr:hypothetical protein [Paenibacillus terrae]